MDWDQRGLPPVRRIHGCEISIAPEDESVGQDRLFFALRCIPGRLALFLIRFAEVAFVS
jgi:hypothetical protein